METDGEIATMMTMRTHHHDCSLCRCVEKGTLSQNEIAADEEEEATEKLITYTCRTTIWYQYRPQQQQQR